VSLRAKLVLLLVSTLGPNSPAYGSSTPYHAALHPLSVGAQLPRFTVLDEANTPVAFEAARLQQPTVFIFYQGGWAGECRRYLRRIRDAELTLRQQGFAVVFLSADRPEILRADAQLAQLPYTLLSDSSMQAARAFGVSRRLSDATMEKYKHFGVDLESISGQSHHEIAVPAAFIVDGTGMVRFAWWSASPTIRIESDQLLAAAGKLTFKARASGTPQVTSN